MIIGNSRTGEDRSSQDTRVAATSPRGSATSSAILVVDDDEPVRKSLIRLLTCHGYSTIAAANGAEALRLAVQHRPCVILMDMELPLMNGFDASRAIKAHATLSDVQIIALSASPISQYESASVFAHTLQKPCPAADVIAAIEAAVFQHCCHVIATSH